VTHRPRVLVVSSGYPDDRHPASGGFVRDQAELAARTFDVAVLVPQVAGWRECLSGTRRPGVRITREAALTVCRTTVWHPPLRPAVVARLLLRAPSDARSDPGQANAVLDLLLGRFCASAERGARELTRRWGDPDLVHAHFVLPAGWAGLELARRHGVPMVLTEHSGPFEAQVETPLRRRVVRETLLASDLVLAVSPFQAERIRRFEPATRLEVLGNAIRDDLFTPADPGAVAAPGIPFRFLAAAHLGPLKGVDTLVRAGARLAERHRTRFVIEIVGDGPERSKLEGLASELDLGSTVRFLGAKSPESMPATLRGCDALVVPSRHETFGMVVGEAMACGKPVVATRCGGPEFLVEPDTGLLVEVDDPESLADAMQTLLTGERSFEPGTIRSSVVGRFGREVVAERLTAVYQSLLTADRD